jgi:glycine cleavage system aminomethyltransferase T
VNKLGRLEADLTVIKLSDNDTFNGQKGFLVVATDTAHRHVETRIKRYIAGEGDVKRAPFNATVTDVTGGFAQITLQGPYSRRILQAATDHDMSDANFPFRAAREVYGIICICVFGLGMGNTVFFFFFLYRS